MDGVRVVGGGRLGLIEDKVKEIKGLFACSICGGPAICPVQGSCGHLSCSKCMRGLRKEGERGGGELKCKDCGATLNKKTIRLRGDTVAVSLPFRYLEVKLGKEMEKMRGGGGESKAEEESSGDSDVDILLATPDPPPAKKRFSSVGRKRHSAMGTKGLLRTPLKSMMSKGKGKENDSRIIPVGFFSPKEDGDRDRGTTLETETETLLSPAPPTLFPQTPISQNAANTSKVSLITPFVSPPILSPFTQRITVPRRPRTSSSSPSATAKKSLAKVPYPSPDVPIDSGGFEADEFYTPSAEIIEERHEKKSDENLADRNGPTITLGFGLEIVTDHVDGEIEEKASKSGKGIKDGNEKASSSSSTLTLKTTDKKDSKNETAPTASKIPSVSAFIPEETEESNQDMDMDKSSQDSIPLVVGSPQDLFELSRRAKDDSFVKDLGISSSPKSRLATPAWHNHKRIIVRKPRAMSPPIIYVPPGRSPCPVFLPAPDKSPFSIAPMLTSGKTLFSNGTEKNRNDLLQPPQSKDKDEEQAMDLTTSFFPSPTKYKSAIKFDSLPLDLSRRKLKRPRHSSFDSETDGEQTEDEENQHQRSSGNKKLKDAMPSPVSLEILRLTDSEKTHIKNILDTVTVQQEEEATERRITGDNPDLSVNNTSKLDVDDEIIADSDEEEGTRIGVLDKCLNFLNQDVNDDTNEERTKEIETTVNNRETDNSFSRKTGPLTAGTGQSEIDIYRSLGKSQEEIYPETSDHNRTEMRSTFDSSFPTMESFMWKNAEDEEAEEKAESQSEVQKKYVFCPSRLNRIELAKLSDLCSVCDGSISKDYTEDVTHLIIKLEKGRVPQTMKYFFAIADKKWIIVYDWVLKCLEQGEIFSEEEYETSTYRDCDSGARRSRIVPRRLLQGMHFYFPGILKSSGASIEDCKKLVEKLGGTVLRAPYDAGPNVNLVIVGEGIQNRHLYQEWYKSKGWISIAWTWILDCLLSYTIVPFDKGHLLIKLDGVTKISLPEALIDINSCTPLAPHFKKPTVKSFSAPKVIGSY